MYRWVLREQEGLCPGACWRQGEEEDGEGGGAAEGLDGEPVDDKFDDEMGRRLRQ